MGTEPRRPAYRGSSSACTPQRSDTSLRAAGSVSGRPPGSSPDSAPASRAPRSPARRGTQPSRAPVFLASAAAADRAPGIPARRSPTSSTAPGVRSAAPKASSLPSFWASSMTWASAPGWQGTQVPCILASPPVRDALILHTRVLAFSAARRSRSKTMGDSSSGSNPTNTTLLAASRSAYVGPSG